jgi:peroxiredoxin
VERFLQKINVSLPVLLDPWKNAADAWKVKGLPMTFLVDAGGNLRYWSFGEQDWSEGDAFKVVENLVKEAPRAQR